VRNISVVCPICKQLTPVVDKTIMAHGEYAASGMRYLPSPIKISSVAGGPRFEVMAARPILVECSECHESHEGVAALVSVHVPNPQCN